MVRFIFIILSLKITVVHTTYLQQAHQHNTADATKHTTYNEKYKFVHSELLSLSAGIRAQP